MNLSQQAGFFSSASARKVTLIGAGSVGSKVANELVRIGVADLTVYDGDSVDSHNIPSSYFGVDDFGRYKSRALADRLLCETGKVITVYEQHYCGTPLKGTVIMCVDTMEARQGIWKKVKHNPLVDILIDTRTAEKFWQLFSIEPCKTSDIAHYEPFLAYGKSEAAPQTCGHHSISYVSSMVAAEVAQNLSDFWSNGTKNRHIERLCGAELFINHNS